MSNTALDIRPELLINAEDNASVKSYSYRIDSGVEDLNRTLASDDLVSLKFANIQVNGFNRYYHLDSSDKVADFIKAHKAHDESAKQDLSTDYPLPSKKKEDKGNHASSLRVLVAGYISISFSEDKDTQIAAPVYEVQPNDNGEYLPVAVVDKYISETWTNELKEALFHAGKNPASRFGAIASLKQSQNTYIKLIYIVLGLLFLFSLMFLFNALDIIMATENKTPHTQAASPVATVPPHPLMVDGQNIPTTNAYPVSQMGAAYQPPTPEQYAQIQQEQTEELLKKMGIDVSQNAANLGCFAANATMPQLEPLKKEGLNVDTHEHDHDHEGHDHDHEGHDHAH